jgi:flagellar basal-body rod protein FlgG
MVRSLYSAASGMMAQQTNVDVIANNLANVNTVGFKSQSTEFKSLLYQDMQALTTSANGEFKPVSAQVGLGSRISSITAHYTQGSPNATDSTTDFYISGDGFFAVQNVDGETYYTRNGNFYFAIGTEGSMLCTSEGYPVLSSDGQPIVITEEYQINEITVDSDGNICYPDEAGNAQPIGIQIGLYQFSNPSGLTQVGGSYLTESDASGIPLNEAYDDVGKRSTLKQGYLEASNVNVATEMVNLITAQRAYELCSKAITTSDTMLEQANNLKR